MTHRTTILLLCAAGALACTDRQITALGPGVNATVRFVNLEGGCWSITPDERVHYLPLNLATEFKRDGLKVRVDFVQRNDYVSVCQVGPVIQIRSISTR